MQSNLYTQVSSTLALYDRQLLKPGEITDHAS